MCALHRLKEDNIISKINFADVKCIYNKRFVTSNKVIGQRRTYSVKRSICVNLARYHIEDSFHPVFLNIVDRVLINECMFAIQLYKIRIIIINIII